MKEPSPIALACADNQRSASTFLAKVLTTSLREFVGLGMRAW
jgi:hypothetical protein